MSKIINIVKIIMKYSWLFPLIKEIIVSIAEGIKKAKKDGKIEKEEIVAIVIIVARHIFNLFEIDNLDIQIKKK